jgi:hypothetical protein
MQTSIPDISVAGEGALDGRGTWNITMHPKRWLCTTLHAPDVGVLISQLNEWLPEIRKSSILTGKEVGRVQEGGTAMLCYGTLIEQCVVEKLGRDESGRWVVMTFRGRDVGLSQEWYAVIIPATTTRVHMNARVEGK